MIKGRYAIPTRSIGAGKNKENGLSIIILGGQAGYRMRSYGNKSLLRDKYNKTVIENQTEIFGLYFPHSEIILTTGFEADKVIRNTPKGVRIVENQLFEKTNEVEEARLAVNNAMYDSVLLVFGDIYFNQALMRDFQNKESTILVDDKEEMLANDVGVRIVDNYATIFSYGILTPRWTKIVYLTGKEFKIFKQFVSDRNNANLFLFEALNFVLDKNGQLKTQKTHYSHEIIHLDTSEEVQKIK